LRITEPFGILGYGNMPFTFYLSMRQSATMSLVFGIKRS